MSGSHKDDKDLKYFVFLYLSGLNKQENNILITRNIKLILKNKNKKMGKKIYESES